MTFDKMFERGKIGNLELKNRIVMTAMGTSLASSSGEASDEIIKYYEERAKGGTGLIITEITRIDDETGIGTLNQLSVTRPRNIPRLSYLADAVHRYDSKIFVQLHHPGRQTPKRLLNGLDPVAPSPIACKVVGDMPRELTTEEVEELVKKFVTGAVIAQTAGIDGVEVHAAHGYLVNQFLSPYTNQRQDKYGGSFENRLRFLTEIVMGIKAYCGKNYPVSVRISADEFIEGGNTLEDTVKIAKHIEAIGADCINVSCGMYETGATIIEPAQLPEAWKKHLAKTIKENVSIPVIAVNNIKHPETAEALLEEEVSDFIGLGRCQLTDPAWANKAEAGDSKSIRKCIGCLHCFKILGSGLPVGCTINPRVGREYLYADENLRRDGAGRTVAIIGGGPSGMEAAKVLAKRGFKPVIYEKEAELGGTAKLAALGAHKELLGEFIETQVYEMEKLGVELKLNTEASVELIKELDPYAVVLALGGKDIVPGLKGIDSDHVYGYRDILLKNKEFENKKIAVIGGGETGLETAEFLADNGANDVTVVEMKPSYGDEMYTSVLLFMKERFAKKGLKVMVDSQLEEVTDTAIVIKDLKSDSSKTLDVDAVVLAIGVYKDPSLINEFKDNFERVISVGDSNKPGNIHQALKAANDRAFVL